MEAAVNCNLSHCEKDALKFHDNKVCDVTSNNACIMYIRKNPASEGKTGKARQEGKARKIYPSIRSFFPKEIRGQNIKLLIKGKALLV